MTLPRDLIAGVVLLMLCAILFYVTTTFEEDLLGAQQGTPPTLMPRLILGVIALLSVIMILQGLRAGPAPKLGAPPVTVWATALVLGAAAIAFDVVGVPLVFSAICVIIPVLWGARNWLAIILFALAVPTAIYGVFRLLLEVRFPMGPLAALGL